MPSDAFDWSPLPTAPRRFFRQTRFGVRGAARTPKTNTDYWVAKIDRNHMRDAKSTTALDDLGWHMLTVWECAVKDVGALTVK